MTATLLDVHSIGLDEHDLQSSDTKHKKYANLLLHPEMQLPDLRNRQRESDKVDKDAVCGMCEGEGVVVDAFPSVFTIPLLPREADRRAYESGGETERYHGCNLNVDDSPHNLSEALFREDLEEEEQERDLDESKSDEIRNLADPEILQNDISGCLTGLRRPAYQ